MRGGTSRHVLDVVSSVEGMEHHVAVPPVGVGAAASGAPPDEAAVAAMVAAGATVHRIDMRRNPASPANWRAVGRLAGLRREVAPSVVHGHSSVGGALARLAAGPTPAVYTPNGLTESPALLLAERALGRRTAALVAVSDSEATLVRRHRLVADDRLVVVANGIDLTPPPPPPPPWDDLRGALGVPAGSPLVGTVARLVAQKAPERFVAVCAEVAHRVPGAHFLLVGDGPLRGPVDEAVARAGLGRRWHRVDHLEGAASVLGQLDCFVLASRFEGGPYTPLEAMRAGVPVVLSDVVGNRDVVRHGVSGLLAPFGDDPGMGAAVASVLTDASLAGSLSSAAAHRLRSDFDLSVTGRRLGDLYRRVA